MLVREKRAHYEGMESMRDLVTKSPGFNLADEFFSRWYLVRVDGLSSEEAARAVEMRMVANFETYCLEKDADYFELNYKHFKSKGISRLNTSDHSSFASLEYMCLEAAKKSRSEGGDWMRETAVLMGTRRLSRLLQKADIGEKYVLFYPPLPDGDTSIIYEYEKGEAGEVLVKGKMLRLSLSAMEKLYYETQGLESPNINLLNATETERELVATPVPYKGESSALFARAISLAINEGGGEIDSLFKDGLTPSNYKDQLRESGIFLARYLEKMYQFLGGRPLSQYDLNKLEMAFSFARRAVMTVGNRGEVLSHESLEKDLFLQEEFKRMLRLGLSVDVAGFNWHLAERYGFLNSVREMGGYCPEAMLMAMGLGGGFDSPEVMMQALGGIEGGACGRKVCAVDRGHSVPDEATECPVCGWAPGKSVSNHRQRHEEVKTGEVKNYATKTRQEKLPDILLKTQEKAVAKSKKRKSTEKTKDKDKATTVGKNLKLFGVIGVN
jgi:hypothetical protein